MNLRYRNERAMEQAAAAAAVTKSREALNVLQQQAPSWVRDVVGVAWAV
jgi:hypothetical protein